MPARIAIVEDEEWFRRVLRELLRALGDCECVGCYASAEEALAKISLAKPDIVLSDIRMPGMSGFEFANQLKLILPNAKVILVTGHADKAALELAMKLGLAGFLIKPFEKQHLIDALRAALHSGFYAAAELNRLWPLRDAGTHVRNAAMLHLLSAREWEVLDCCAQGLSFKQISDQLKISDETVNNHMRSVRTKLNVHSAIEAINKAYRRAADGHPELLYS